MKRGIRVLLPGLLLAAAVGRLPAQGEQRPETAVEWNAAGISALEAGRLDEAVAAFEHAHALAGEDAVIRRNLARARGHRARASLEAGRARDALEELARAIALDRDGGSLEVLEAQARLRLGQRTQARRILAAVLADYPEQAAAAELAADLEALEGRLSAAVALLEKALESAAPAARDRLERRLAQLREEQRAWAGALTDSSAHFDFRYDATDEEVAGAVPELAQAMERAYDAVSEQLGLAPRDRILVLVLSRARYRDGAPEWSAALYDGRIRVAVGAGVDMKRLAGTLRHEYTHAALHRLGAPVPTWLHEGLAQHVEGVALTAARRRLRDAGAGSWPSLQALAGDWSSWRDRDRVRLAYDYSRSFVAWLEARYGSTAFRILFEQIPQLGFDRAFTFAFGRDAGALEAEHRRALD